MGREDLHISHAIGLTRRRFIKQGLFESLEIVNYHSAAVPLRLSLGLGTDFADIFEVRGFTRSLEPA